MSSSWKSRYNKKNITIVLIFLVHLFDLFWAIESSVLREPSGIPAIKLGPAACKARALSTQPLFWVFKADKPKLCSFEDRVPENKWKKNPGTTRYIIQRFLRSQASGSCAQWSPKSSQRCAELGTEGTVTCISLYLFLASAIFPSF